MKKIGIAVLSASAMAFALPAAAQNMSVNNIYAGISLGQSTAKDACNGTSGPGITCDDSDTALGIFAGYQINQNFAAELGYHDLGKATASGAGVTAEVKATAWDLVAVGMLPFANQFTGYGKLGLYYGKAEGSSNVGLSASDTNTGLTYGLGVQWDPMKQLGVRVEYQVFNDVGGDNVGKSDVSVISIGALWRFQ